MNSFPVLLLPGGEQMDVHGAGGKPPGTDEATGSGEEFQGVLQQILLGSAVQMLPVTPAPSADGGSAEAVSTVLLDACSFLNSLGFAVESPPELLSPVDGPASGALTLTSVLSFEELSLTAELACTTDVTGKADAAGTVDLPDLRPGYGPMQAEQTGHVAGELPASPAADSHSADARAAYRSANAMRNDAAPSSIPVSPKEGDVPPTRVQESAPAAMVDVVSNDAMQGTMRSLKQGEVFTTRVYAGKASVEEKRAEGPGGSGKDGVQAAGPRESDGQAIQQVAGGTPSSQENATGNTTGQRNELLFAAPLVAASTAGSARGVDLPGGFAGMFSSLSPETAQSVVDQVMKGFAMQMNGSLSEFHVTLEPESLGEMVLHVRMENGKMQAQIDVTQAGVKTALESSLPQLRLSLSERGIDVQRIDVAFGGDHPGTASGGGSGDGYARHGFRRNADMEAIGQYATGRLLGYNTMELVM